ncbi:hypothetical protein ILUMI_19642 [Ignelater luminosus]|uniref:Uncharacterized protein n=1 Tax=Ignelater luminosus TaxID=2038154 RepID=A0A8K0G5D9_IGNLU|nr:hypothetical protein ILUMI_19642 [Ignelater luminosus]
MKETENMIEIGAELRRYGISIAALQEVRWQGKGKIKTKEFTTIYSEEEKGEQKGLAFMPFGPMTERIIKTRLINGRMAYIRIRMEPFNLSLLGGERKHIPKEDAIVILCDLNAQISIEKHLDSVAGKHTIHKVTIDNGHKLCKLAARNNMIVSSTKFKHPKEKKRTWTSPDQKNQTQIYHVLITRRRQSSILDSRKKKWIEGEMEEKEKENNRRNARNFYQKVKQQTRTHKLKIREIENKEGKTVQAKEEIKEVWMTVRVLGIEADFSSSAMKQAVTESCGGGGVGGGALGTIRHRRFFGVVVVQSELASRDAK